MNKINSTSQLPQITVPQPVPSWLQHFSPLLQQARLFTNNNQDKKALVLARAEYKRQPSLDALEHIFDSYIGLAQLKKAQDLLKEMKKLGAPESFLHLQKATYCIASQNLAKAQSHLDHALEHKDQLDNRHRAYLYFTQGAIAFSGSKPQTFPFTQALHYDYLLMPCEQSMCYLMRGLIRLDQQAYDAAYQDAQSVLHVYPQETVAHYLRAVAGYHAGHLSFVQQDIEIITKSKNPIINKTMKSTLRKIQDLLPKEPVIIDNDFMDVLYRRFFEEVDDMINATDTLEESFSTWTGAKFENKMKNSIKKSLAYLQESLSKLNAPDLPQKLAEIQEHLQFCVDSYFTQPCLDLITLNGPDTTTLAQLRTWKKQMVTILEQYHKIYTVLVDKLEELTVLYHIPVFIDKKSSGKNSAA